MTSLTCKVVLLLLLVGVLLQVDADSESDLYKLIVNPPPKTSLHKRETLETNDAMINPPKLDGLPPKLELHKRDAEPPKLSLHKRKISRANDGNVAGRPK